MHLSPRFERPRVPPPPQIHRHAEGFMSAARTRTSLLLGVLFVASPMPAAAQGRLYSPIEAAAVGRAVLDAQVARYGRVRNANWDQEITLVLTKLQRATGYPASRV